MKDDEPENRQTPTGQETGQKKRKETSKNMGKTAKKPASGASRDLFELPDPAARGGGGWGRAARTTSARSGGAEERYTARDIEVLEGLEPVRRRPGMYIRSTHEKGMHQLFAQGND